jgi:protease-4
MIFLGISLLFNLGQFASGLMTVGGVSTRPAGPRLNEVVLENNGASAKIAVVDILGIIRSGAIDPSGYTMVDLIKAQLDRAGADSRVNAVVLRVDSPGGEVLASDEIYRVIADFQKESGKAVVASMGNLAASGGYYVSAPCRWIVANELTITGSIGVILNSWNYRNLMTKVGVQPMVYKSGKFKDMLGGHRDPDSIPPEEIEMINGLIDETFARFKEVVEEGRNEAFAANGPEGKQLAPNWAEFADGRILSGKQAFELGFVDELGNFQDAVERAKTLAEVSGNVNLVQYQQQYDLSDLFRIFGKSESTVVKVDLGVETPKLEAGRLYFLSPTYIH